MPKIRGNTTAAPAPLDPATLAPGGADDTYPDYGNRAAGYAETMSRREANGSPALTSGTVYFTYFTSDVTVTVGSMLAAARAGGAPAPTLTRMGIYTVAPDGALTLAAWTVTSTTFFTTGNNSYARALDTSTGLPSPYQITRGTRYAFAILQTGSTTTVPTGLGVAGIAGVTSLPPRSASLLTGQTDLPATVAAAGLATAGSEFYIRAY